MMRLEGERKSNFGIGVTKIPKKKKMTSILVIVLPKYFPGLLKLNVCPLPVSFNFFLLLVSF